VQTIVQTRLKNAGAQEHDVVIWHGQGGLKENSTFRICSNVFVQWSSRKDEKYMCSFRSVHRQEYESNFEFNDK
jgi:hypothetical protein